MKLHDRAWAGFRIGVIGSSPMIPMKIEQALSGAAPAIEIQISSFESYDQAYRFCKEQKDVGFLIVGEKCGDAPFTSVFRELASQFKIADLPAFGMVFYEGEPNAFSERTIGKTDQLVDYTHVEKLTNPTFAPITLDRVWSSFVTAFETKTFPIALQDSVLAVAEDRLSHQSVHFLTRLTNNLASDLNLSWLETVALKWAPFLAPVLELSPSILKPHLHLQYYLDMCRLAPNESYTDVKTLLKGNLSLCKKAHALVQHLESERQKGTLHGEITRISAWSGPGAPKLVRHIAANKERILSFDSDARTIAMTGT